MHHRPWWVKQSDLCEGWTRNSSKFKICDELNGTNIIFTRCTRKYKQNKLHILWNSMIMLTILWSLFRATNNVALSTSRANFRYYEIWRWCWQFCGCLMQQPTMKIVTSKPLHFCISLVPEVTISTFAFPVRFLGAELGLLQGSPLTHIHAIKPTLRVSRDNQLVTNNKNSPSTTQTQCWHW